jgi:3-phenylpropionate/trans-cinnamate dioxygenase ferredoxin reductase subunit
MSDHLVIIGAGECGARASLALREHGHVGQLTLIGEESLDTYERPPLSKALLIGTGRNGDSSNGDGTGTGPDTAVSTHQLDAAGIDFRRGRRAASIQRTEQVVTLDNGDQVAYDRLLLATGARARKLSLPGGERARTLRTFDEALAIRDQLVRGARVVVIGGGFIGLEVAAAARTRGCEVTVLELAPRILGRAVPAPIAHVIAARHAAEGVSIICDVRLFALVEAPSGTNVVLDDGTTFEADIVVAGVGSVPNTELAEAAGLTIANGISVDEQLRTDDLAIFAAGDCCSFPHRLFGGARIRLEAWRNALDQAVVAARNMLGASIASESVPWFWSDQYELGLQIAGLPDPSNREVVRHRSDGADLLFGLDDTGRIVSAAGVAPGTLIARDIRIAELLIARKATPDVDALCDPSIPMKQLLESTIAEGQP